MPHIEACHLIAFLDLQTQSCIFNDHQFSVFANDRFSVRASQSICQSNRTDKAPYVAIELKALISNTALCVVTTDWITGQIYAMKYE